MIGQTFAPLWDPAQQRPAGPTGGDGPSQAIQTLSLRIPRVVGAGSIAPSALLTSPGSGGLPTENMSPLLQQILQAVLGRVTPQTQSAPTAMGGFTPSNLPPPKVTPIGPS